MKIIQATRRDVDIIYNLFQEVIAMQEGNDYKVWKEIDKSWIERDIENKLQYKMLQGTQLLGIFSVQYSDPLIWGNRDQNNAVYLHRILANPVFRGQRLFEKVLSKARRLARQRNLEFIRMDTWSDNTKLIGYYQSFGFKITGHHITADTAALPVQNRNLSVVLLEMKLV